MEKELLKIMNKFYIENLSKYEKVWFVAKLGLRLDSYGRISKKPNN